MRVLLPLTLLLAAACGGSGSPTSPAVINVAGVWTGNATSQDTFSGGCQNLTTDPTTTTLTITFSQTGSNLNASVLGGGASTALPFTGTIDTGGAFTLVATAVPCYDLPSYECAGAFQNCPGTFTFTGQVSGRQMTGTFNANSEIRSGGVLVDAFSESGTFTLSR